jgi:hypothetical protein
MENYVAAVFPTREEAGAANAALLELARRGLVRLQSAELYGRSDDGELVAEGSDTRPVTLIDVAALPGGTDEESADELSSILSPGMHAVLAHVIENDPSPIDDAMRANGGIVYRRSLQEIESSGMRRFSDASRLY